MHPSDNDTWKQKLASELGSRVSAHDVSKNRKPYVFVQAIFPWLLTILLGVCVAFTGVYIAVNCDFLSDLRLGYCHNLFLADRKRCCGGVKNFNENEQRCVLPRVNIVGGETVTVNWVAWESLFGLHGVFAGIAGYIVAFILYFVTCTLMTCAACILVQYFAPQAKGSGIPEVKASIGGFDLPKAFRPICLLIKSLGLSLAVGAGLSLGKEGPLIHVGVCWAYLLSATLPLASNPSVGWLMQGIPRNELAAIGAATGVSTAFGAPLGGVLFAVEELGSVRQLSKRCLILCFLGSFSSSFCLKYMNLSGANTIILFGLSQSSRNKYAKEWVASDVWIFVFLGVVGGLCGAAFVHLNCAVAKLRRKTREEGRVWLLPKYAHAIVAVFPKWMKRSLPDGGERFTVASIALVEGLLIATITVLVNFPISNLLKFLTVDVTHALFETCPNEKGQFFGLCHPDGFTYGVQLILNLITAAVGRFFLTVLTFGMSVPSGLFIPSLFIGACVGRAVGTLLMMVTEAPVEPGSLALIGASAMLGGFSRLTVSLVVIMFELTGDITMVVPVMCACLTSKIVGDYFNDSIYDEHAVLSGFAIIEDLPDHVRFHVVCSDIMEAIDSDFIFDASRELEFSCISQLIDIGPDGRDVPSVVLLKRGRSRAIFGAIETVCLREWLSHHCTASLTFRRMSESPLLGITPTNHVARGVTEYVPALHITGRETSITFGNESLDEDCNGPLLDISHVVDTHIARIDANAPISLAYFIFHQNPELNFIICLARFSRQVGVITRRQFADAIGEGLAYPPLNPLANYVVPSNQTPA